MPKSRTQYDKKVIDLLYHFSNFYELLESFSISEIEQIDFSRLISNSVNSKEKLQYIINNRIRNDKNNNSNIDSNNFNTINSFQIDIVMSRLRSLIMNSQNIVDNAAEINWLIRILLASPQIFPQTREIDNFLSNMTGMHHDTKNTGRDRIIDWYFKAIDQLPKFEQDEIFYKIAKYLFINLPSNYKEWKEILYKGSDK